MPLLLSENEELAWFDRLVERCRIGTGFTRLWRQPDPLQIVPGAHFHRHWELRMILRGRVSWPDRPDEAHPPLLVIPPDTIHQSVLRHHLGEAGAMLVLTDTGQWTFQLPGGKRRHGGRLLDVEEPLDTSLTVTLEHLARDWPELTNDRPRRRFWESRLKSFLLAFRMGMRSEKPGPATEAALVERACRHIEAAYVRPDLSVNEIARACGCTPTHLAHAFRRHRGQGVRRTLVERRLEHARDLLESGHYRVNQAAHLTGWRSPNHFSNAFERHFGYRPIAITHGGQKTEKPGADPT